MHKEYKQSYERETQILKELNKCKLAGFLRMTDCGYDQHNSTFFIVTDLLGSDIYRLMQKCDGRRFRPETAIKIGLQMFNRIADIHKQGYVHRDIKLNNFVCAAVDNFTTEQPFSPPYHRQAQVKAAGAKPADGEEKKAGAASASNEIAEDDFSICLIDYGISKKIEKLTAPEQQQKLEELKKLANVG